MSSQQLPGAEKTDSKSDILSIALEDLTDFEKTCLFVTEECGHHKKLLEGIQALTQKIEEMKNRDIVQPEKLVEMYKKVEENLIPLQEKLSSETPTLDRFCGEVEKLRNPLSSSQISLMQWRRLARMEENIVHVMADIGYDILTVVQDIRGKMGAKEAQLSEKWVPVFTVDPKHAKQMSITKYLQFLRRTPPCVGECACSTPSDQIYPLVEEYHNQGTGQLDREIHIGGPILPFEVCPLEVVFKNFESVENCKAIINYAASTSYTNIVSSIFIPNRDGPLSVQIPWMRKLNSVNVLGKVNAEMHISVLCQPSTFNMNVIDCDKDKKVIIFGKDFIEEFVQMIDHRQKIIVMKSPNEIKKMFSVNFSYSKDILDDIEATFARLHLRKESKAQPKPEQATDMKTDKEKIAKIIVRNAKLTTLPSQLPSFKSTEQADESELCFKEKNLKKEDPKSNLKSRDFPQPVSHWGQKPMIKEDPQLTTESKSLEPIVSSEKEDFKLILKSKNDKAEDEMIVFSPQNNEKADSMANSASTETKENQNSISRTKNVEKDDPKLSSTSINSMKGNLKSDGISKNRQLDIPKPHPSDTEKEHQKSSCKAKFFAPVDSKRSIASKEAEKREQKPSSKPKGVEENLKLNQSKKSETEVSKPVITSSQTEKEKILKPQSDLKDQKKGDLNTNFEAENMKNESKSTSMPQNLKKENLKPKSESHDWQKRENLKPAQAKVEHSEKEKPKPTSESQKMEENNSKTESESKPQKQDLESNIAEKNAEKKESKYSAESEVVADDDSEPKEKKKKDF